MPGEKALSTSENGVEGVSHHALDTAPVYQLCCCTMLCSRLVNSATALLATLLSAGPASATVLFSDNFSSGASAAWGDQSGNWRTTGGVYDAGNPDNSPVTYTDVTTLPSLTNFSLSVDVNSVDDGGVWLRSSYTAGSISGVLLVTGGSIGSNNRLYWHTVVNGAFSRVQQPVGIPGLQDSNIQLRIDVVGDTYSAFLKRQRGRGDHADHQPVRVRQRRSV
jgi:hypothetical protein